MGGGDDEDEAREVGHQLHHDRGQPVSEDVLPPEINLLCKILQVVPCGPPTEEDEFLKFLSSNKNPSLDKQTPAEVGGPRSRGKKGNPKRKAQFFI